MTLTPRPPITPDEEFFERIEPSPSMPAPPAIIQLDPSAPAAELFASYDPPVAPDTVVAVAGVSAPVAFGIEESAPRPASVRLAQRPLMKVSTANAKPKKPAEVAYLLETPPWSGLWPLALLTLVFGWIGGGFLAFERLYAPDSVLPALLLALGGAPVALAAFVHYLRPQRIPLGTAIGVALFTAVIGIVLLLLLQTVADVAAHARVRGGRGSFIWAILFAIGSAYDAIHSDQMVIRWLGFVFGVGLFEEATKLLPLVALIIWRSDRHLSVHSFLCLGFISGLGFGIGEAIYGYAPWNGVYGVGDNIIRWYSAVPSHAIYTTVCAAFLWRQADHLEHADGFWERALVIALAVGLMAVVHGTYNTVCSLGVVAALLMEVVSFVMLIWAVRWITVDATEPPGHPPSTWVLALAHPSPMRVAIAASALLLLVAMGLGGSREAVLPAILRSELPSVMRPYVDGVTIERAADGAALGIPLTVAFRFNQERLELVGHFTNRAPQTLRGLVVTCRENAEDQPGTVIELGELAAGAAVEIDDDRGWTFAPGEHVTLQAEGFAAQTMILP